MQTKHKLASIGLAVVMSMASVSSFAQVTVGGAPMLASKDIIDNAVNSKDTPRWSPPSRLRVWSIP